MIRRQWRQPTFGGAGSDERQRQQQGGGTHSILQDRRCQPCCAPDSRRTAFCRKSRAAATCGSLPVPMIIGLIGCSASAASARAGGCGAGAGWRVDRASVLQSPVEIAFEADHGIRHLLVFRDIDDDVGRDSLTLNGTAGGRVVERRGQPERAAALQRDDRLHRALAKAAGSHHGRAAVVLQGAGDDFGSRRRGAVDQHDDGRPAQQVAGRRSTVDMVVRGVAAAGGDHDAAVEKNAGDIDRSVEQPAGVVAQIEDEAVQPALRPRLHPVDRTGELGRGVLGEGGNAGIADVVRLEVRFDRDDADHVARQRHIERAAVIASNRQDHSAACRPAQPFDDFLDIHPGGRLGVDLDDAVSRLDARLGGRRAVDRRDHLRHLALEGQLDADAAELAAGDRGHLLILLLIHVIGMRDRAASACPSGHPWRARCRSPARRNSSRPASSHPGSGRGRWHRPGRPRCPPRRCRRRTASARPERRRRP